LHKKLPAWFKQVIPPAGAMAQVSGVLAELNLNTVCGSAHCPNIGECFSSGTATFMILGNNCTRNCTFCAVEKCLPSSLDPREPENVAEAVRRLALKYVVVTSVTRDDLPDGGAAHFARTVELIHQNPMGVKVEVLVPDFKGDEPALRTVVMAKPEVMAHNLETVPRLYSEVRPMAHYQRSLELLYRTKQIDPHMVTKSALMLGMGETKEEVRAVMRDLRQIECDLLTLGQYLSPSSQHRTVVNFITPEEFAEYEPLGLEMGFKGVASAPLVRSSYKANELFKIALGSLSP
jgi:lipoic acid synthetase